MINCYQLDVILYKWCIYILVFGYISAYWSRWDPTRFRVWADDPLYAHLPRSGHCTYFLICIFVAGDRLEGSNWIPQQYWFIYRYCDIFCYHMIYDVLDAVIVIFSAVAALGLFWKIKSVKVMISKFKRILKWFLKVYVYKIFLELIHFK